MSTTAAILALQGTWGAISANGREKLARLMFASLRDRGWRAIGQPVVRSG